MCVKTNVRVSFSPPEVTDEDCLKILYYHHQNFTICQRVVEITMNEENEDSSKQLEPDFSEVYFQKRCFRDYFVVYGFDYSHGIYEVDIYASLSLLEKFARFFEKIPQYSSIAFIIQRNTPFVPLFVEALLRQLGRKAPINAKYDPDKVETWLYNNEARRDLIAHASTLKDMKAEFVVNLSPNVLSLENISVRRNVTSRYTDICLPNPSHDELKAMKCFGSDKFKQSDGSYSTHRDNMDKYLKITNFEEKRMGAFR